MVDFNSLDVTATGIVSRFHNFAKNIETAHLGKLYTQALDGLNYYVVERAAKPALQKAPEWVTSNRAVSAIQSHLGLSIVVGAAVSVVSFILFMILLHPKGTTAKPIGPDSLDETPPPSDNEVELDIGSDDEVASTEEADPSTEPGSGASVDDKSASGSSSAVPPPAAATSSGAPVDDKSASGSSSAVPPPPAATTSGAPVDDKGASGSSSAVPPPPAATTGAPVDDKGASGSSSAVPPPAAATTS
jgi:hypothetical protein